MNFGCTGTHFVNANGIHDDNHITTAHDLAIMAKYCMQNETFRKIICSKQYTLPATDQYPSEDRVLVNTNSLMAETSQFYYPYAIAGKTGFTTQAKNCLICMSQKDGLELISVVLHAETTEDGRSARYLDTINLLEYGNNNFASYAVPEKNEEIAPNNSTEESKTDVVGTKNSSEPSSFRFTVFIYILMGLVGIRLLIAFLNRHIVVYRAKKLKKRARKYLNP